MTTVTRWVQYSTSAEGSVHEGDATNPYQGTKGYTCGRSTVGSTGDAVTIGPTNNRLHITVDGYSPASSYLTLYSGENLDPRFVARNITELMHQEADERWKGAVCKWENVSVDPAGGSSAPGNCFKIYSGTLGTASSVTVASGTYSAHSILGFDTSAQIGGLADGNTLFTGDVTISGTYNGFFDEVYRVVVTTSDTRGIGTPSKGGSNTYDGVMTTGGVFNGASDATYVISVDVTNGTVMGAGSGNVPTITWTSTGSDDSDVATELLYPDHWYSIGDGGLMVKFSDGVFNTVTTGWTIVCTAHQYSYSTNANSAVGSAYYVWGSDRGDDSAAAVQTVVDGYTRLGSRGLYINFSNSGQLGAKYEFYVICTPPQPQAYDITGINYGNVTVSAESDIKVVMFEIISGAVEMSSVKFGLQSHGTFQHHDAGNLDTYFRFGTVGPANNAGTGAENGLEWRSNVVADDLDSDTPPTYLYFTNDNLPVVSTADESESIGNVGLVADPIFLGIRLGANEAGAATLNYRLYFDYSG